MSDMRRRELIALVGAATVGLPHLPHSGRAAPCARPESRWGLPALTEATNMDREPGRTVNAI
jgi:hypothetical protein